jgi:hypothetical protein
MFQKHDLEMGPRDELIAWISAHRAEVPAPIPAPVVPIPVRTVRGRHKDGVSPVPFREAEALLHLDRSTTLVALVKSGQLHTVPWGKETRIPRDEVERLAREGFTATGKKAPRRTVKRRPNAAEEAEKVRALRHGRKV